MAGGIRLMGPDEEHRFGKGSTQMVKARAARHKRGISTL